MSKLTLYSWWRSSCSWRVRTALLLKGLDFEIRTIDFLGSKDQESPEFRKISAFGQVPVLLIGESGEETAIVQSLAIIQWLEEAYPETTRLLPSDPLSRARVRMIADSIAAGIQPLQNKAGFHDDHQDYEQELAIQAITCGFRAVEQLLDGNSGKFCVGDEITMADVCLVPQVYNATRFGIDVSHFPIIQRIYDLLMQNDAFVDSHPNKQPDCPHNQKDQRQSSVPGS